MELLEARSLVKNQSYGFRIRDWETPLGDVIQGAVKEREFVEVVLRSTNGAGSEEVPFIRVLRSNGTSHLIAIETIKEYEVVHAKQ